MISVANILVFNINHFNFQGLADTKRRLKNASVRAAANSLIMVSLKISLLLNKFFIIVCGNNCGKSVILSSLVIQINSKK